MTIDGLHRVRDGSDEAFVSLPPDCYRDLAVLSAERQRVFHEGWLGVGRADRWGGPGAYAALDIAGSPVIMLRDASGSLRAFANVCRHRGSLLLDGDGVTKSISCPFHRWTYGLDGALRGAPDMEQAPGFDRARHGLIELPAAERFGFAFVSLAAEPPDIDDWLGDFGEIHAPWSLDTIKTAFRRELSVNCDWKVFLDVFNEYYHLRAVHPDSIGDYYMTPDKPEPVSGTYATQFGETTGASSVLDDAAGLAMPTIPTLEGRNRRGTRYTWLFPNMAFAAGSEAIWVYDAWPDGPGRCRVGLSVGFAAESFALADFERRAGAVEERMMTAIEEDIAALERQQRGLESPHARQGPLSPTMEPCVGLFARWYAARLAAA